LYKQTSNICFVKNESTNRIVDEVYISLNTISKNIAKSLIALNDFVILGCLNYLFLKFPKL